MTRAQLYRKAYLTVYPEDKDREPDFRMADTLVPDSNLEVEKGEEKALMELAIMVIRMVEKLGPDELKRFLTYHINKN